MDAAEGVLQTTSDERQVRRWGFIGGMSLVLMAALALFANFVVLEGLVTPGDAGATARDVAASEGLFQWGIVGWFVIAALDMFAGWALFHVFKPVHPRVAMLSAWSRYLYGAVLAGATTQLSAGFGLLTSSDPVAQSQGLQKIESFTDIWNLSLILFGVHLLLAGYLAYRSGYVPKRVGAAVGIAGFGYLFDAAVRGIVADPSFSLSVITGLGEFVLAVWLASRSHRICLSATSHKRDDLPVAATAQVTA